MRQRTYLTVLITCGLLMLVITACAAEGPHFSVGEAFARLAPAAPAPPIPATGWLTLDTPHFLVHYPPGQEMLARRTAAAAEEAHHVLVPKLQYLPEEKTNVVLADSSDVAQATTTVNPYNKIVVHPAFPDNVGYDTGILPGTDDWLKQLMVHEYAHVLHLDMNSGSTTQLRRMFGKVPWASTPNALQGEGVLEGYATLMEGTNGFGRGDGALYDMFLRVAVLADRLPTWSQILGDYPLTGWQPGPAKYLYGYSFLDYIAKTYGDGKLGEIHRLHAAEPFAGPSAAFADVLDVEFAQLWRNWRQSLAERYNRQVAELGAIATPAQVDVVGQAAHWPRWSPDGRSIVYGSSGDVIPALRLRSATSNFIDKGKQDTLLVNGVVDRSNGYTWLPDGKKIIYGKLDYDQDRLLSDLYLYNTATRKEQRLTKGYRAYAPTVSPNGEWVAFLGRRDNISRILVSPVDKIRPLVLWAPNELGNSIGDDPFQALSLAWSPKGDVIALTACTRSGNVELFLLSVENAEMYRLTYDSATDADPAWSPDGRYLFFSSDRGGIFNIHVYDTLEKNMWQVTRTSGGFFSPSVSPDGKSLVVTSYMADGYDLALIPITPEHWTVWPSAQALASPTELGSAGAETPAVTGKLPLKAYLQATGISLDTIRLGKEQSAQPKRPAWEQDISRAVDPRDFLVRSYTSRESLAPRYWLPMWGGKNGAWLTGGSTSATDALGRHAYHVSVSLGGANAAYEAGYEHRPGALGAGTRYGLQLSGTRTNTLIDAPDDGVSETTALDVEAPFATNMAELYISWPRANMLSSRQYTLALREGAGPARIREAQLGGWWQAAGGNGPTHRAGLLNLQLSHGLTFAPTNSKVTALLVGTQYVPDTYRVTIITAAGAARSPNTFVLNGNDDIWQVRGAPQKDVPGQYVATATVEAQFLLSSIKRGVSDQPIFFDNLSTVLFSDAAVIANGPSNSTAVVTAGAELRLTTFLGYGSAKNDFRIGAARSLERNAPWHLYFGLGSGF